MVNSWQFDTLMELWLQEIFNHPAVQAGLAPFLAALVAAELFQRPKLSGLAIIAGFAAMVYLASDFNFDPLTSSRKIVLSGLAGTLLALLIDILRPRWFRPLLPVIGGAVAIWTAQRILQQQDSPLVLQWGAACAAYVALLVWGMDKLLEQEPVRAPSAAVALGFGTGVSALVGASALLGQFGLALGSAAAAHLLIQMFTNQTVSTGRVFTFPLALIAGLTGCIAVLSARLPWYVLFILAAIPLTARFVHLPGSSIRVHSLLLLVLTHVIAASAVYLTWRSAGDVPF
jgi:hypothetical protein